VAPISQPTLDQVRDAHWRRHADLGRDGWFLEQLRRLLTVARQTQLRTLFYYTSHNSLHFSRCSQYPYTRDCPWILFSPGGRFITYPPNPRRGLRENWTAPLPHALAVTDDAEVAVAAVTHNLPSHWQDVWIGSVTDRSTSSISDRVWVREPVNPSTPAT
jgi:hypothetical protein